jgi:hypothetical protein
MKIQIKDSEIREILEMHSKMKKSIIKEQQTKGVDVQLQEFITNGCFTKDSTVIRTNSSDPQLQFAIKRVSKQDPSRIRYFYINKKVAEKVGDSPIVFLKDPWDCPKTENLSKLDVTKKDEQDVTKKEEQIVTLGQAQAASTEIQDILKTVTTNYDKTQCEQLIDNYFTLAQVGGDNPKLNQYKRTIISCNNKNRGKWSEKTKDQLRWLTGNEDKAKGFLGVGKRFKSLGNIKDQIDRRPWQLYNLPI